MTLKRPSEGHLNELIRQLLETGANNKPKLNEQTTRWACLRIQAPETQKVADDCPLNSELEFKKLRSHQKD